MGGSRFSYSRMTTFEQCARRYRYRYLDQIREGFTSIEAFMGSRAHGAIEWLWRERQQGRCPDARAAVARYCDDWDREYAAAPVPVKVVRDGEQAETYRRMGAEMVADYHRDRFLGDDLHTEGIELHVEMTLSSGHGFQGFIDRLARGADGRLHVIDYKTGKRVPSRFEGKDADQLRAYAVALFSAGHDQPIRLRLEYLRTGRILEGEVAPEDAPALERRLAARVQVAAGADVFPPAPGPLCGWCGFNDVCDAATGAPRRASARVVAGGA
jgi:putative RecB family exonuclease